MPPQFPRVMSTFGATPYAADRDDPEKNRALYEHYIGQVSAQPLPDESLPWNVPFPPGVAAQEAFDDMLQRRVVDPLAKAGYEDVGAGLAAIPSAAHSMIVPQTEFDVAGTIIPLPGIAKAMKKGKFRKIRNAMKAEDPENVGRIIAEQAGKDIGSSINLDPEQQKISKVMQDKFAQKNPQPPNIPLLEKILSRYVQPYADELSGFIKRDLDAFSGGNTYFGANYHKPIWEKPNTEYKQPIPLPPEYLDKVGTHVGKNLMQGGVDPFQWLDNKYGSSKAWLKKTVGQPRTIETQSDLIAHDDYIDSLTPKDKVIFHITGENNTFGRLLTPGAPSHKRIIQAAEKLADAGIDVTIKRHVLPGRENIFDIEGALPKGIKYEQEVLKLDPEQIKSVENVLGYEAKDWPTFGKSQDEIKRTTQSDKLFELDKQLKEGKNPPKVTEPPRPPKGDPEASLNRFDNIRSKLDVAPSRMDERGRSFGDVGQSELLPDTRPQVRVEDVPRRNYVESEMDPKEKMWSQYVERNLYLKDKPEELKKLRDYFDNRWDQAQGTAEGKMMQFDMPVSESWKPRDQKSVSNNYIDELAFKKFAKPYEKTMESERKLQKKIGFKPVNTAVLDALIQTHFDGYQIQTPGRKLQNEMYKGRPSFKAEQEKYFPKVREQVGWEKPEGYPDSKDIDKAFDVMKNDQEYAELSRLQKQIKPSKITGTYSQQDAEKIFLLEEKKKKRLNELGIKYWGNVPFKIKERS